MGKVLKGVVYGVGGLLALIVVLAAALFGYRAYVHHRLADELAITTPNGIVESGYVPIGGTEEWIQIRGQDRNNPVLLFVHGGAGASAIFFSPLFAPWEKEFTVVFWDERGAGRSLAKTGPEIASTMT